MSSNGKAPKRNKRKRKKQGPVMLIDDFVNDFPMYWKPIPTILPPEWLKKYEEWKKKNPGKSCGFTLS